MTDIRIEQVDDLDCRVIDYDWAFAREEAAAIEANWQAHIDQGRKLWNGRVLVAREPGIVVRDGRRIFEAQHFVTSFKAFLAFRDFDFPDPAVRNCFAMAALRAADGPFLLARMAAHTANAGLIYFAAGTPDHDDIRGDRLDLAGSVLRELTEETGLTSADVAGLPGYTLVFDGGRIACLQELRTYAPADEVIARVARFLEGEKTPEIDGLLAVRSEVDFRDGPMLPFIQAYLRHRFAEDAGQLPLG